MLSILLRLLPLVALSAFNAADAADAGDEDQDDATGNDGDKQEPTFTQADVDAIFAKRINRERRKLRDELADKIRQELKAEAERAAAEEAEEFRPLYESEKEKREQAEREAQQVEARWRERLVRSEIKVAAAEQQFVNPEVVQKLIDIEDIAFDDDGEPMNITDLVTGLARAHPYLIQSETDSRTKPVEHSRANGKPEGRDDIKNKYLGQVGRGPRSRTSA